MDKEYVDILHGSLYGFMEGDARFLEKYIFNRFKSELNIEPEFIKINVIRPYENLNDESYHDEQYYGVNYKGGGRHEKCIFQVIVLSVRINGEAHTIVRDTQAESDLTYIQNKSKGITYEEWVLKYDF